MSDPDLTNLLKWGVENSDSSRKDPTSQVKKSQNLNTEALAALFGNQPSNAQLMKDLKNRLMAFDNFEQLIEGIDNANNIGPLELWEPLVKMLRDKEAELRTYAAWCCATAVQNNIKSQERVSIFH
jgi:hsp70-interacting protein